MAFTLLLVNTPSVSVLIKILSRYDRFFVISSQLQYGPLILNFVNPSSL